MKTLEEIQSLAESELLNQDTLDELVIDCKCAEASDINNSGQSEQLTYILEFLSRRELEQLLS